MIADKGLQGQKYPVCLHLAATFIFLVFLLVSNSISALVIAPMMEGTQLLGQCQSLTAKNQNNNPLLPQICAQNHYNLLQALQNKLDSIEPGGAKGEVQLGYTYVISLLSLYEQAQSGKWRLKTERIRHVFDVIRAINRPVVLYLMLNHFDSFSPLAKTLAKDKDNLMLLSTQQPPMDQYFHTSIIPFTLDTDETIAVNQYRFQALREIFRHYQNQPQAVKKRVIAFTLGGELHYLFPHFKTGTGNFKSVQLSDYSPRSIRRFQRWLQQKYTDIANFNQKIGARFADWQAVKPPDRDIRAQKLDHFFQHLDSYAHGALTISGWLWDKHDKNYQIDIYLDGKKQGQAQTRLNRMDVYQALDKLQTPLTGFRYLLDYSATKPGIHTLHIVLRYDDKQWLLSRLDIVIMDQRQSTPQTIALHNADFFKTLPVLGDNNRFFRYWIDQPHHLQDYYYNPLARLWYQFRGNQIKKFLTYLWQIARDNGIAAEKLFSHQIPAGFNSSWNPLLFASDDSLQAPTPYQPGLTLYGGATLYPAIARLYPQIQTRAYGVPEFHPQLYKSLARTRKALRSHLNSQARFVSPYFMTFFDKLQPDTAHDQFRIDARNPAYGSDKLFQAIYELVND